MLQVCGKRGHCAGFVGSIYHDCPFKVRFSHSRTPTGGSILYCAHRRAGHYMHVLP